MTQQIPFSSTKLNKVMNPEQFNQVVEAILAGKYSWACVLILRFAGYNPLHYIPYRTYNRLTKENSQANRASRLETDRIDSARQHQTTSNTPSSIRSLGKINDLGHLEVISAKTQVRGGNLEDWLHVKLQEFEPNQIESVADHTQNISLAKRCLHKIRQFSSI